MNQVFIDVRERDEFSQEHIEHSINVPLSSFASVAPGVLNVVEDREIVFLCHSGIRSAQAVNLAKEMGYQNEHSYSSYQGGLLEWKKLGKPIQTKTKKITLPIIRQVHLTVGSLIIVFGLLGGFVNSGFAFVAAAMGAGLLFAGATGICAMANVLALMPWNKSKA